MPKDFQKLQNHYLSLDSCFATDELAYTVLAIDLISVCFARIKDRLKTEQTKLSLFLSHKFAEYIIIVLVLVMFSPWQSKESTSFIVVFTCYAITQ